MSIKIMKDGKIIFGNPKRKKNKPYVYQIIKTNYNHKTGDVINTYCIQKFNSKTLQYFVEVCPQNEYEYTIGAKDLGKKNLTLKDCRSIVKTLLEG